VATVHENANYITYFCVNCWNGQLGFRQNLKYRLIPAFQLTVILSVLGAAFFSIIFGGEESLPSCRPALQLGDLNSDGIFTIKDPWPNVVEIYNFPYVYFSQNAAIVALNNFFEVADRGCRSLSSRVINAFIWTALIFIVSLIKRAVMLFLRMLQRGDAKEPSNEYVGRSGLIASRSSGYFDLDLWPIVWLALLNSISLQSHEVRRVFIGHQAPTIPSIERAKPKSKDNHPRALPPKREIDKTLPRSDVRPEKDSADGKAQEHNNQNSVPKEYSSGF